MIQSVLVVDDERMIREAVSSYMEKQGCKVFAAATGKDALIIFEREAITFVILDLMLPDMSGEEICTVIRKKSRVPIIMLTAKTQEDDVLCGLGLGFEHHEVYKKGVLLSLTPVEWKIFSALIVHPKKNYTREELIELVFEPGFDRFDCVIDTHIKNLRKK